jgi:hypothetical protein
VFTASLPSYLDTDARTAFLAQLREVAARRPVAWVFAASSGLLATTDLDLPALNGPRARRNSHYPIGTSVHGPDHLLPIATLGSWTPAGIRCKLVQSATGSTTA